MEEIGKNSVLIVTAEKSNGITLAQILNSDYIVYTANEGQEAVGIAEEYLPDLIFTDVMLPGIDGYEVLTMLKNSEKTRDIPVILVTGPDGSADEEKGLTLGAADYIIKPFNVAIVKLRIKNHLKLINQIRTIERMSTTDQLTGLPNRRSFDSRMDLEWKRAMREKTPVSILIADIDKFKVYNDKYGHQQGDVALKAVAAVFPRLLKRSLDFAARWGGEEFAVLLANTDASGALVVAERLRAGIEASVIPCHDGADTSVTVSIGVNTQIPEKGSTIEDFIEGSDKALYAAKESGRNKVCPRY